MAGMLMGAALTAALAPGTSRAQTDGPAARPPIEGPRTSAAPASGVGDGRYRWWRQERARRQAELDQYLAAHQGEFESFLNKPLGTTGVPAILLRIFPELEPGIWGGPEEMMPAQGFGPSPFDPRRTFPLGLGYTTAADPIPTPAGPFRLQVSTLSCAGCHVGRVAGPDGRIQHLIGAPNTQFNQFRTAVERTVTPWAADIPHGFVNVANRFNAVILAKGLGEPWVYNDPALAVQEAFEKQILLGAGNQLLGGLFQRVMARRAHQQRTLGRFTYAPHANAPDFDGSKPGHLDAIGVALIVLVSEAEAAAAAAGDPEAVALVRSIMPPAPAEVDIPSVWRQRDRSIAQWDGSIEDPIMRNLAASLGVVGTPTRLTYDNAVATADFASELPPPPYPFDVDTAAAARGRSLYKAHCAGCHAPNSTRIFPADLVGTDPNRAEIFTEPARRRLIAMLRVAYEDDDSHLGDEQILRDTRGPRGYVAPPLDGIWARAPYLHNGSVPTLYHLLAGERPARFVRGDIRYDQQRVGFAWSLDGDAAPGTAVYDTLKAGNSNNGHDTPAFNGAVDWKNEPRKLSDLLEYLKTL